MLGGRVFKLLTLSFVVLFLTSCGGRMSNFNFKDITKIGKNKTKKEDINKKVDMQDITDVIYSVKTPNQRVEDRGYYFGHEYKKIKLRRRLVGFDKSFNDRNMSKPISDINRSKPKKIVGLGFSGGGN